MTPIDTDGVRRTLEEERARVAAAIDHLERSNPGSLTEETGDLVSSSIDQHPADMATETFDRELEFTLEESNEHVLQQIDAALKRLDDGTYGTCITCGNPIGDERLEAMPYATQCIDCRRREERG